MHTASTLWGRRAAKLRPDTHVSSIITLFGIVSIAENYREITQGHTLASHKHCPRGLRNILGKGDTFVSKGTKDSNTWDLTS